MSRFDHHHYYNLPPPVSVTMRHRPPSHVQSYRIQHLQQVKQQVLSSCQQSTSVNTSRMVNGARPSLPVIANQCRTIDVHRSTSQQWWKVCWMLNTVPNISDSKSEKFNKYFNKQTKQTKQTLNKQQQQQKQDEEQQQHCNNDTDGHDDDNRCHDNTSNIQSNITSETLKSQSLRSQIQKATNIET